MCFWIAFCFLSICRTHRTMSSAALLHCSTLNTWQRTSNTIDVNNSSQNYSVHFEIMCLSVIFVALLLFHLLKLRDSKLKLIWLSLKINWFDYNRCVAKKSCLFQENNNHSSYVGMFFKEPTRGSPWLLALAPQHNHDNRRVLTVDLINVCNYTREVI